MFEFLQNPPFTNNVVGEICPYTVDFPNIFQGKDFFGFILGTFQFNDTDLHIDQFPDLHCDKRTMG